MLLPVTAVILVMAGLFSGLIAFLSKRELTTEASASDVPGLVQQATPTAPVVTPTAPESTALVVPNAEKPTDTPVAGPLSATPLSHDSPAESPVTAAPAQTDGGRTPVIFPSADGAFHPPSRRRTNSAPTAPTTSSTGVGVSAAPSGQPAELFSVPTPPPVPTGHTLPIRPIVSRGNSILSNGSNSPTSGAAPEVWDNVLR